MSRIEKVGKNRYKLWLEVGMDASGKRKRHTPFFHGNMRQAQAEMIRMERELQTGTFVDQTRITVREYLRHWLKNAKKGNVSPRTYERYEEIVELHLIPALGAHKLKDLRPLHIQTYYAEARESGRRKRRAGVKGGSKVESDDQSQAKTARDAGGADSGESDGNEVKEEKRGLSAQTVAHHATVLKGALKQAVKWQILYFNPADSVERPRPEHHEVIPLTQDETVALLMALRDTRYYVPAVLAATTGMRRGEVLGLRWRDVDLDAGILQVRQTLQDVAGEFIFGPPKTKKSERAITLLPMTVDVLRKHKAAQNARRLEGNGEHAKWGLVMCRDDGRPWHPGSFTAEWKKTTEEMGFAANFHKLRHTMASLMFANKEHPKVVQERLGHSTITTTMDTYSHMMPNMQGEAAANLETSLGTAFGEAMKQSG